MPGSAEIAIDVLVGDHSFEEGNSVQRFSVERGCGITSQFPAKMSEILFEPGKHKPAISRAGPAANLLLFDHQDRHTAARKSMRRCETSVASSHNRHIGTRWQHIAIRGERRSGIKPETTVSHLECCSLRIRCPWDQPTLE
jgi:hypothetical protein